MEKIQYLKLKFGDLLFKKYKDSTIKIQDHFKLATGKTPPTKNPEYYENGTFPWLNGGTLTNLYFLTDGTKPSKLITEKAKRECKLLESKPWSIIFSNVNTDKDRIVFVKTHSTSYFLGEHIWQINSTNQYENATLFFALRQIDFSTISSGSVFSEVQRTVLINREINWVSNPEKQKIFLNLLKNKVVDSS